MSGDRSGSKTVTNALIALGILAAVVFFFVLFVLSEILFRIVSFTAAVVLLYWSFYTLVSVIRDDQ